MKPNPLTPTQRLHLTAALQHNLVVLLLAELPADARERMAEALCRQVAALDLTRPGADELTEAWLAQALRRIKGGVKKSARGGLGRLARMAVSSG